MAREEKIASAGHRLGQIIGDWYEKFVALPLLMRVGRDLNLFVDSRFTKRSCRGEKLLWKDDDGNVVDYDFVLELGGTAERRGAPVAFFETFWRRGSRHSKDKARDDTGKLLPMRNTYPTARMLGIIAAGDFTGPAQELVSSKKVDLFYIPKCKIISAWKKHDVTVDYSDKAEEAEKSTLARNAENAIEKNPSLYNEVADTLITLVGKAQLDSYEKKIAAKLGAIPQEHRIVLHRSSKPFSLSSSKEVDAFLTNGTACTDLPQTHYSYEVVFGDGDVFVGEHLTEAELKKRHLELKKLIAHMESLS